MLAFITKNCHVSYKSMSRLDPRYFKQLYEKAKQKDVGMCELCRYSVRMKDEMACGFYSTPTIRPLICRPFRKLVEQGKIEYR